MRCFLQIECHNRQKKTKKKLKRCLCTENWIKKISHTVRMVYTFIESLSTSQTVNVFAYVIRSEGFLSREIFRILTTFQVIRQNIAEVKNQRGNKT